MIKKIISINSLYIVIIFTSILFEIYFSYLFKNASSILEEIEIKYNAENMENIKLRSQIAKYSSLVYVETQAKKLGFIKNTNLIYISSKNFFAQK